MAGGLAYLTGFKDQPMRAGASITDIGAATYGVIGILAALYRRETTGEGDNIEAGLYETVVFWISQYVFGAQMNGVDPPPRGSRSSGMGANMGWGVYRLFPTRSGAPDIHRGDRATGTGRGCATHSVLTTGAIPPSSTATKARRAQAAHQRARGRGGRAIDYDDIAERLYKALVPFSPVNTPLDLVNEKHLNEGGHWMHLKVGDKPFKLPKLPITMGRTAEFAVREQPGGLGAHTDSILATLGYSAQDIEALKAEKIVLRSDRMLNTDPSENSREAH